MTSSNFGQRGLLLLLVLGLLEDGLEREGDEEVALALVELGLELDPVETECVEERGETLHQTENGHGAAGPERENGPENQTAVPKNIF